MKIGASVDQFGIELNLSDEDVVTDMIMIAKVLGDDGRVYVCMAVSEGTDWLNVRALTEHAYGLAREDDSESDDA